MPPSPTWESVAYVDESFNESHYWITVVVVPVELVDAAKAALRNVVVAGSGEHGISPTAELHGHDLWHATRSFEDVAPWIRALIYRQALNVLGETPARVVIRGLERSRVRHNHPHRIAWRYAIEDVDQLMSELGRTALVVADVQAQVDRHLPDDIARYRRSGTGGWKSRTIANVLERLEFVDSADNHLIQYADLVAYLHQRRWHVNKERDARSQRSREQLWSIVEPLVFNVRCWRPWI